MKAQTKFFKVSIRSRHNAQQQLEQVLEEERKCGYIREYEIEEITQKQFSLIK